MIGAQVEQKVEVLKQDESMRGIIKRNNSDTNAKVNRNVYGITRVSFNLGSSGREGE